MNNISKLHLKDIKQIKQNKRTTGITASATVSFSSTSTWSPKWDYTAVLIDGNNIQWEFIDIIVYGDSHCTHKIQQFMLFLL